MSKKQTISLNDRQLVSHFIISYNKPFNAETVSQMTGLPKITAQSLLSEQISLNKIKLISSDAGGIYVRVNRFEQPKNNSHNDWTLTRENAFKLYNVLLEKPYYNVRDIAKAVGYSRQWVSVYLRAMISIKCVSVSYDGPYKAESLENISKLGLVPSVSINILIRPEVKKQLSKQELIKRWYEKLLNS